MTHLRSQLNPEEQSYLIEGPTAYRCGPNQLPLTCDVCGGTFYVDEGTFSRVASTIVETLDNTFRCEECEVEFDELSHG